MSSTPEDILIHFGKLGMKWGKRNNYAGASPKVNREASGDAKEFARAKMFYGQGAGTRRKLIKAKVEAKSKRDPTYKPAFDHHLANQDLGKHAGKAQSERKRKDVRSGAGKAARGINRSINGPFAVGLTGLAAATAVGIAQNPEAAKKRIKQGEQIATQLIKKIMKKPTYYSPDRGFYR